MHDAIEAGPDLAGLFLLASEQGGYFTSAQAHAYGYTKQLLAYHAKTGRFQRRRRGQQALHAEPWPEGIALAVRATLHTGEADLREGDYYGSAVNR
jgi:hypothetical protein